MNNLCDILFLKNHPYLNKLHNTLQNQVLIVFLLVV